MRGIADARERMHACSDNTVKAINQGKWDLAIQGIIGVADEFRKAMELCGMLPEDVKGKYILKCGREHHSAKGKIAAALKKVCELK